MRFVAALTLAVVSLAAISPERHLQRPRIAAKPRGHPVAQGIGPEASGALDTAAVLTYADGVAVATYLDALERARLQAAAEAAAREAAAAAARQVSSTPAYHPGTTVGECTGFAVPDYIINRESSGQPFVLGPIQPDGVDRPIGCAQTLLSHYSSGQCQGLDPYTIDGQRECVWRLSNGGTNLAPWSTR